MAVKSERFVADSEGGKKCKLIPTCRVKRNRRPEGTLGVEFDGGISQSEILKRAKRIKDYG